MAWTSDLAFISTLMLDQNWDNKLRLEIAFVNYVSSCQATSFA